MAIRTRLLISYCLFAIASAAQVPSSNPSYTIQTIAGSDFTGDGGPAIQAILSQTEGIAVDKSGTST